MSGWLPFLADVLGASHYRPSRYALASDPVMMILFVAGWMAAAGGCFAIGATLVSRQRLNLTITSRGVQVFGALFILIGLDFALSATTVFTAVYRLKAVVLGMSAAVIVTTAILTITRIYGSGRKTDEG